MRRALAWLTLMLAGQVAASGQTDYSSVRFHYERAGLDVPTYTFVVLESGKGTYTAEGVPVKTSTNKYSVKPLAGAEKTVQPLDLSQAQVGKLIGLVQASDGLRGCESKAKNIADTGTKTLTFHEAYKSELSCTFNYSENKAVVELTSYFQAMAFALDEARKMEGEQKFDRLGLDGEMTTLVAAVKDGRAMGLSNIRGTLQGLVDDPAVLERVRVQAAKLLQQSVVMP